MEYEVEGNSVLPVAAIERAVTPFLGIGRTVEDVEAARTALEKTYQDAGFLSVFVDIPEQRIGAGTVVLRVTEGAVERLLVAGARHSLPSMLKGKAPALAEGEVPYFPDVQQQLAQLNRGNDRQVTPVLRAGRTPGTVEAELKVDDKLPLHGSIELNNRYSFDTTRPRLVGSLRYDNLWQRDHSLSLAYQTTPVDTGQVNVLSATYVMQVGKGGAALALYGVDSDSNLSTVGATNIVGRGQIFGMRYIRPLPARGPYSHTLTLGVDTKNFKETVRFGADTTSTPIRYIPFLVTYGGRHSGGGGQTQFSLAANFHLRGFGDHDVECNGQRINAFACRRFGADSNFFYLRAEASHTHALPAGLSVSGRVVAQHASGPLISNEQFGAGGADTVRGYTEFERVGDRGVLGSVELRSPNLGDPKAGRGEITLHGFLDAAALSLISPLAGQAFKFNLASAGFGLRVRGWAGLSAALELAWPLRDGARSKTRDPRAHARLAYEF